MDFSITPSELDDLNRIIAFLAVRDIKALTPQALHERAGLLRADLLILLGGITTPDFACLVANAWKAGLSKHLVVVGGTGHSTQNLRANVAAHPLFSAIPCEGRPEADILTDLLADFYHIDRKHILVENESTNCGNNATLALEIIRKANLSAKSAILVQDPVMQCRSLESFRYQWRKQLTRFYGFAPAIPFLSIDQGPVHFADSSHGSYYKMQAFLELVMGEIPRLRDDENGYGPKGHGFIGHVEIPQAVEEAFLRLAQQHPEWIRSKWQPNNS